MNIEPYYQDDFVTIYCGDNRQVTPWLGSFDLLLTDPPYGINENDRKVASRGRLAKPKDYGVFSWDKNKPEPWFLNSLMSITKHQIIFGGNYFGLPPSQCWLVWDKENGTNDFADCELAWTNLPKAVRKFTWRWSGMLQEDMKNKENRVHPTQKPLPLMHWCLGHVPEAKTVLDPFMGSGTTLLAAKQKGLKATGIEISEKYCEAAVKRLQQGVLWQAN